MPRLIRNSVTADKSGNYSIDVKTWVVKKSAKLLVGVLSYNKMAKGVDIAVYTHENLEPYVPRPKTEAQKGTWYASKPGTGPKYLEIPISQNEGRLRSGVRGAVTKALKVWRAKHKPQNTKRRKGK